ncbi:hypothetical protein FHS85_005334 [Rhodoligotrophos appendicifer]|uniref:hypothetical protein n=1 Tax=Rhodoligotrophos appendicifer TaxID=987056 RepID=UPI0011862955|nr:hypothetical protein [Rhodoligotrophos appendicifer]
MHLQTRQAAKLSRVARYGGVALIVAWSLLALCTYAGIEAAVGWMAGMGAADGLIARFAQVAAPLDGPLITIVWFLGLAVLVL